MGILVGPFVRERVQVISGPAGSEKDESLAADLDSIVDSGFVEDGDLRQGKVLLVRHPKEDPSHPDQIGRHRALATHAVRDIYEAIEPRTEAIIISGASHFEDPSLAQLVNSAAMSGRIVVATLLNLDIHGNPFGSTPGDPFGPSARIMTLADKITLAKGICYNHDCRNLEANRSVFIDDHYRSACTHHFSYPDLPNIAAGTEGRLTLYVGSMYSGKSKQWARNLGLARTAGRNPVVFKWLKDSYGQKMGKPFSRSGVELHSGETIDAILVRDVNDIRKYLDDHQGLKDVFIDEGQFFPGIYDLVKEKLPQGYRFDISMLLRSFNREPFGDGPRLACLADEIIYSYAYCSSCKGQAAESQRFRYSKGQRKRKIPARHDDLQVVTRRREGQTDDAQYEARCIDCLRIPNSLPNPYELPKLRIKRASG